MNGIKAGGFLTGIATAIGLPFILTLVPSLLGPMAGTPICHSIRKAPLYSPDGAYYASAEIYSCNDDGRDGPLYVLDVNSTSEKVGALLLITSLKERAEPTVRWESLRSLRVTGLEDLWPKESKSAWCDVKLETDARP